MQKRTKPVNLKIYTTGNSWAYERVFLGEGAEPSLPKNISTVPPKTAHLNLTKRHAISELKLNNFLKTGFRSLHIAG